MKEFGSDFNTYYSKTSYKIDNLIGQNYVLFANGRQALLSLLKEKEFSTLWIPYYYCYDVIDYILRSNVKITINYYDDSPFNKNTVNNIPFGKNDLLLKINYFGLKDFRDSKKLNVTIIEDHSHDLMGFWCKNSNADYCFASLRKTLPLTEGGVLWSPSNKRLPKKILSSAENDFLSFKRYTAMDIKSEYLVNSDISKEFYRSLYIETEEEFDHLNISGISELDKFLLDRFDIKEIYDKKLNNWIELTKLLDSKVNFLRPQNINNNYPFSLILVLQNERERDILKNSLIKNNVYPAILWPIPKNIENKECILSIHCDFRYNKDDMNFIAKIINNSYEQLYERV